ncbi:heme/copper-type cytochrome/quinol oxidase, subunit 2 [Owenweeksia hongkongensis DSM 17368]|uniref:Cytochrome c oxidase subunit 2 n=1 Tax=Owenweeksia hongkongensis (strain DSM 17368 / CIP 108786 / JCM 12287 / NRRL B-23963 / UST20020801) TaxID=926562 RepID=G8R2B3_OWEHD|nr:cytochrome c oxidase subunit II [Owenweeksia hongkongensis]AEV32903.1 heme/copper-type cytochrome/quinol oxidase, subunit 2 [Owenweeksia hongkongensis DSM 17368]
METFLIIVIAVLGLVAFAQIVRVFELSSDLKGKEDSNDVNEKDNNIQGILMGIFGILLVGGFTWMWIGYDKVLLPVSASEHGVEIDNLMWISMAVIIAVFFITQPILFGFTMKFRGIKNRKAVYMEHNNKLEFIWTIVPAVVLACLIIYGLTTWSDVMNPANETEEPMVIEVYAQQFKWTARYAGDDNALGYANVRMIEGVNSLGVDVNDVNSLDDVITSELHLPVGKPVLLKFRSQDVIHSAYLPHFRVQMNCVPGTNTQFQFTPSVTTVDIRKEQKVIDKVARINEIRAEKGEDTYEYDYFLLCNKICGSAHYNMQMKIVVETQEEYEQWMSEQKTFADAL